jgi:hypothetical protein
MLGQQNEHVVEIESDCARGCRAVDCPPLGETLDFPLRAGLDDVRKCHGYP